MRRQGRQAPRGMLVGAIVLPLLLGCLSSIPTPSSARTGGDGGSHVYAWGDNRVGQLGDGATGQRAAPVAVALPAGVRTPRHDCLDTCLQRSMRRFRDVAGQYCRPSTCADGLIGV